MIVFKLTIPTYGSWNGLWSGENRMYARVFEERHIPKEIVGKSFYYRWNDGWVACVDVIKMPTAQARKIERQSYGFFGYDWMITSLINDGYIHATEYINREDALEIVKSTSGDYATAWSKIRELPAVDMVPLVRGRWELGKCGTPVCSACHGTDISSEDGGGCFYRPPFCMWCGAQMDLKD